MSPARREVKTIDLISAITFGDEKCSNLTKVSCELHAIETPGCKAAAPASVGDRPKGLLRRHPDRPAPRRLDEARTRMP